MTQIIGKVLRYYDENRREWVSDSEITEDKIRVCIEALMTKRNSMATISSSMGVYVVKRGEKERYRVEIWQDLDNTQDVIKSLLSRGLEDVSEEVLFYGDDGIYRLPVYLTCTVEVAIEAAVHFWQTGSSDAKRDWLIRSGPIFGG
jgi:hypothetical protein